MYTQPSYQPPLPPTGFQLRPQTTAATRRKIERQIARLRAAANTLSRAGSIFTEREARSTIGRVKMLRFEHLDHMAIAGLAIWQPLINVIVSEAFYARAAARSRLRRMAEDCGIGA